MLLSMKLARFTLSGLMLLGLMMSSACSKAPARPDPRLLEHTVVTPVPDGPFTNRMAAKLLNEREADVGRCNVDKDAIKAWFDAQGARRK